MRVKLIASTMIHSLEDTGWAWPAEIGNSDDSDWLAEFAGRACYQSWSRPNPATATNQAYLAHILEVDHGSVLEHASATFYVTGVSRNLTHELIRHRHLSFSELSQRFVAMDGANFVTPPAIADFMHRHANDDYRAQAMASHVNGPMIAAQDSYQVITERLVADGKTRKQAREAARAVLPGATETKIVVTGNMRAWRYVISKRATREADAEMQTFALEVLRQLREIAPNTFQDMP